MNTFEILSQLRDLHCFQEVFPIDKLPILSNKNKINALVINLDPSHMKGSHWVAVYIQNDECLYFDSMGFPNFSLEFLKFLKQNKIKKLSFNKYQLQNYGSSFCGAYCILFIRMLCSKFTFQEFLRVFSSNSIKNDLIIAKKF